LVAVTGVVRGIRIVGVVFVFACDIRVVVTVVAVFAAVVAVVIAAIVAAGVVSVFVVAAVVEALIVVVVVVEVVVVVVVVDGYVFVAVVCVVVLDGSVGCVFMGVSLGGHAIVSCVAIVAVACWQVASYWLIDTFLVGTASDGDSDVR
jgi:hypothetical protein